MARPSELARRLIAQLDRDLSAGVAQALLITGDAGRGKTVVLGAVCEHARARGWTVARVGSTAAESSVAWGGLAALVGAFPGDLVSTCSDDQRAALAVACGDRGSVTGPNESAVAPLVAAALRHLLREQAAVAPMLLAIDDLHWIDAATAAALAAALRRLTDDPIGVVCAARPADDLPIDLPRLFGDRSAVVEPGRLDRADVVAMLRDAGVDANVPMLEELERLGDGNPLHTKLLVEQIASDGWRPGRLPASIASSQQRRLGELDDSTRDVLAHAAVLGAPDTSVLREALPAVDVDAALLVAERAGIVDGDRFTHATVPAAIVDGLGARRMEAIHRTLADALPLDHEARATHLAESSGPDAELADLLERSAHQALSRGARHLAGERFRRAVEVTPADLAGERWRRTLAAADAFVGVGAMQDASGLSLAAFEQGADPMQRALAGGVHAQVLAGLGDIVATHRFVVDLLAELAGWPMLRAFLGRARVRLEQTFDLQAARSTARSMVEEMRAAGFANFVTEFEIAEANCRYVIGEPVDPRAVWRQGSEVFDPIDFISAGWMALEVLVWSCVDADVTERALEQVERAARAAGLQQSLAKLHDFRGNHLVRSGRWAEGETELRRAMDLAELTGNATNMSPAGLAWVLAATGRTGEAREVLARSRVGQPSEQTPLFVASNESANGFIDLCDGRWEDASSALGRAWDAADKLGMDDVTGMPFRVDLVEALVMCGRPDDAAERAAALARMAERSGSAGALAQAARADVLVAASRNDVDAAAAAAARSLDLLRAFEVPIEYARLQLSLGVALRRAGRRREAAVALGDAAAVLRSLGAEPFLRRCEEELDRLGTARSADQGLTPTEEQIARLVAAGASNTEVATQLIISPRTVESNLTRIYRKLDIRSRSQLAAAYRG